MGEVGPQHFDERTETVAHEALGRKGGNPQPWPWRLRMSGGAPTVRDASNSSWRLQAWLPPPSAPTARSAIKPILMPLLRAAACARSRQRAINHWQNAKYPMRPAFSSANAASASLRGSRHCCGQSRQSSDSPLAARISWIASKRQWFSRASPAAWRKLLKSACSGCSPWTKLSYNACNNRCLISAATGQSINGSSSRCLRSAARPVLSMAARSARSPRIAPGAA